MGSSDFVDGIGYTKAPPVGSGEADRSIFESRSAPQSISGAMMWAKLFRALFSRLFTVPRLHPVMSAISS